MVQENVGAFISPVIGVTPATYGATAQILGLPYDRSNYQSCSALLQVGSFVTTPSSYLATLVVQHSTTSGGTYTSYATASAGITTGAIQTEIDVDLSGAKQFIRLYLPTPTLSGTFQAPVAGSIILGGARSIPV